MERASSKTPLTEAERLELAAKLDKDLDNFIESLPKRSPDDTINFNRWEEELTNHPFFMKEVPEAGSELHPLYEGLQKLKYDPEENEPEELAIAYKDDGNFNFKHKKYRMAIISYTEGINIKCGNAEVDANLLNNRSASHFFLKNYRSALIDCEAALKLKPNYDKALIRAAHCCHLLEKFDKAIAYCDAVLKLQPNEAISTLRVDAVKAATLKERNRRRRDLAQRKMQEEETKIVGEINKRAIKIEGGGANLTLNKLEPQFPQLFNSRVSLNENGQLVWPVIFFYPEYKIMDYIQHFNEDNTFLEQLQHVFAEFPEWDREKKYQPHDLNVYYENPKRRNVKIDVNCTLLDVLKFDDFIVQEGTPRFVILVANSKVERQFLNF